MKIRIQKSSKVQEQQKKLSSWLILLLFFVLISASFSFAQATNAGILPYAKKDGKILVCLGEQSRGWSDFGGLADKDKKTGILEATELTAAREAHEETIGKFFLPNPKVVETKADTENYLNGVNFFLGKLKDAYKIESKHKDKVTKNVVISYTLFIVEVPYVSPEDFQKTRAYVQNRGIKHSYLDKSNIGWVDVNELQKVTDGKTYQTSKNVTVKNISTNNNITLYHPLVLGLATQKGQTILKTLAAMASSPQEQLFQAIDQWSLDEIKKLISQKVDLNTKDNISGNPPLHYVIARATKDLGDYISSNLFDKNFTSEFDKKTKTYLTLVNMLKDAGADPTRKNDDKQIVDDLINATMKTLKLNSKQISGSANESFQKFFIDLKKIFGISTETKDDFVKEKLTTLRQKLKDLKEKLFELSKRLTTLKAKLV